MAPLQHAAEKVANAAIPAASGGSREPVGRTGDENTYREAVRYALADRVVTRREERHLAELAERLGLGPSRAVTLRDGMAAELARERATGVAIGGLPSRPRPEVDGEIHIDPAT